MVGACRGFLEVDKGLSVHDTVLISKRVHVFNFVALVLALALLHLSLTFVNVWPTLRIRIGGEISVELAFAVAVLAVMSWLRGGVSTVWLRVLSGVWSLLVVGRYIDVTTRSLYGRDINLYWDLKHVPKIGAMFFTVASLWQTVAIVLVATLLPVLIYVVSRWCFARVSSAMGIVSARCVLGLTAAATCGLFVAEQVRTPTGDQTPFSEPVIVAYATEIYEFAYEMGGSGVAALGPAQVFTSGFERIDGADVVVVFMESYGAISWTDEVFVEALADSRKLFEGDIRDTGRRVVSAFVESTTFGGESWLAHISFLSATEVRDDRTNARLMAQERDTVVKLFGRHGYRTVAIMPGHLVPWPEGEFYGFDEIYDHERLDYRGPPFGWWSVTDQYALARVDHDEIEPREREPRFIVFTTLSTHAPFTPAPPYQPDWSRMLTADPYDSDALDRAWSDWPDWSNLGPSYVKALTYAYQTVGGYLRLRADRDLVLILIGDHQPPSLVSGGGASWDVPVHVVASRPALLEQLHGRQFIEGLSPDGPAVTTMDRLLPVLLEAFGDRTVVSTTAVSK